MDQAVNCEHFNMQVPEAMAGMRLDKVISVLLPQYSRVKIQRDIKSGGVCLDGVSRKPAWIVHGGEKLSLIVPQEQPCVDQAEDIALDIVFADKHFYIINKPAGLVVHPGAGNPEHTLLNALLHLSVEQKSLPRAGIVHRLDKGTSGLMVVARTEVARLYFIKQLSCHQVQRRYQAVCNGRVVTGADVSTLMRRDRRDRRLMTNSTQGKLAISEYRLLESFRAHSLIEVRLKTGRTHQVRSHMSFEGYPLVGDHAYGGRLLLPKSPAPNLMQALKLFRRPALHAYSLAFADPIGSKEHCFSVPPPCDFKNLVDQLREDRDQVLD